MERGEGKSEKAEWEKERNSREEQVKEGGKCRKGEESGLLEKEEKEGGRIGKTERQGIKKVETRRVREVWKWK